MKLLNPLIKKFKKVTPPKNKNVKFALIAGLATMFFVAPVVTNVATTYQVFDPDIVSNKDMINIAANLDTDTAYFGHNMRFVAPDNGPIKVNIAIDNLDENRKAMIENAVNTMSIIMDEVNPKYKFEINFSPTKDDLSKLYSINVVKTDIAEGHLGTSQNDIYFPTIKGLGVYQSTIKLDDSIFDESTSLNKFRNVFLHEFAHSTAWPGDAYEIEGYTTPTLMQSATDTEIPITKNDLKVFVSKLSDNKNPNIDIDKLFEKILPLEEINSKIDYVKSIVNSEYLNDYFNLKGNDRINDEVEFSNLNNIYAIDQTSSKSGYIFNDTNITKETSFVNLYSLQENQFDYSRFNYNIDNSNISQSSFQKMDIAGTTYMSHNQIAGKWGDNIIVVNIERNNENTDWNMSISKSKIVSQEKYNEVYNNLKTNKNSDYFNNKLLNALKNNNLSSINSNDTLILKSPAGIIAHSDGILHIDNQAPLVTKNVDGILLTSGNFAIIKDKNDNYQLVKYNYDLINDDISITSQVNLINLQQNLDKGM